MPREQIRRTNSSTPAPRKKENRAASMAVTDASQPGLNTAQLEDEIRQRAYELYEERGRQEGFEQDDWTRAENEVMARHGIRKSA